MARQKSFMEAAMGLRFHAKIDDFIGLLHVYPDGGGPQDCCHLTPQRSGQAFLLRGVTFFGETPQPKHNLSLPRCHLRVFEISRLRDKINQPRARQS
jgi:hypothetical protein